MPNISCTSEKTRSDAADEHCSEKTMRTACAHRDDGAVGAPPGNDGVCKGTDHSVATVFYHSCISRAQRASETTRDVWHAWLSPLYNFLLYFVFWDPRIPVKKLVYFAK